VQDIIEITALLLAISASVTLPPLVWLLAWRRRRRDAQDLAREARVGERIERLESEVDALASELTRLNEAQRFLTSVMAHPPQTAIAASAEPSPPR
jgi:hypothetical protein